MVLDASGNVIVYDSGNRRIQKLAGNGAYLASMYLQQRVQEFQLGPGGELYARIMEPQMGAPVNPSTLKLVKFSNDLKQWTVIDEMNVKLNIVAGSPGQYSVTSAPYPPSLEWGVLPDGRLVVGHSDTDHFRILTPVGDVVRDIRIRVDPPPLTEEDKESFFEPFTSGGRSTLDPALKEAIRFPPHHPYYSDIAVDAEGNILLRWAVRVNGQVAYDVYDPNGDYISRVAMDDLPERIRFRKGVVYALFWSPEDLPTITRYRMR